ncbi:MAG: hypothetical protein GW875_11695 [Deltaproteobacteria bacterium]|nr:hypothetical protein [Deltaproteobacteria bacterium]NCP03518.1 hypothetical protein [Deltaproteobacteria bacterium]
MMKDIKITTVTHRELRQFGSGFGVLFTLIGSVLVWQERLFGMVLIAAGGMIAVTSWCDWPGMRAFYVAWMKLAMVMARIMTSFLLTLMYLLVLTPIALLGRACGKRFVERGFREGADSYWMTRIAAESEKNYERQS